jgi:hypothetical protein
MKRVLFVSYSQTGQLASVVASVAAPLVADPAVEVVFETLEPEEPYPFPWPFFQFFDTFPETVHALPRPLKPLRVSEEKPFDLIVLAYQVWFLSPSQPMTAFLQSSQAARLLSGRPVITLIACRNMWLMAQESVKKSLHALGAHLIDNAVLTDRAHSAATFISTPMWMLTGRRGPFLGGAVPAAGIDAADIAAAGRFGAAIEAGLPALDASEPHALLKGLGAVKVNERLIASERIGYRSFRLWGRLLLSLGPPSSLLRRGVLCLYIVFLAAMVVTVAPLTALIKRFLGLFLHERIARQRAYLRRRPARPTTRGGVPRMAEGRPTSRGRGRSCPTPPSATTRWSAFSDSRNEAVPCAAGHPAQQRHPEPSLRHRPRHAALQRHECRHDRQGRSRAGAGWFELPPIGCLACGTSIADQLMPGHGVMVHGELGTAPPVRSCPPAGLRRGHDGPQVRVHGGRERPASRRGGHRLRAVRPPA